MGEPAGSANAVFASASASAASTNADLAPGMVSSGGANWMRCSTNGQLAWTALPSSPKSAAGVLPRNAYPFALMSARLRMTSGPFRRRSSGV